MGTFRSQGARSAIRATVLRSLHGLVSSKIQDDVLQEFWILVVLVFVF